MTEYTLKVSKRELTGSGKLNALRAQGIVPGIIYGAAVEGNINVQVSAAEIRSLLSQTESDNILVKLDVDGKEVLALLKDVQRNFLTDSTTHLDFQAVTPDTVVRTKVELRLKGTPVGVAMGGQVNQIVYEVPVRCAVKDIPTYLEADITNVKLKESLRMSAVTLPAGVTSPYNGTVVLASVVKP